MTLTAPTSAQGLYARSVRLCIDRELSVPVKIEIYDGFGLLERYAYATFAPTSSCNLACSRASSAGAGCAHSVLFVRPDRTVLSLARTLR